MATHLFPSATAISGQVIPTEGLQYGPYDMKDFSGCRQVQDPGTPANGHNGAITWSPAPKARWFVNFYVGPFLMNRRWEFATKAARDAEIVLIAAALAA